MGKKKLFWILQVSGWLAYYSFHTIFFSERMFFSGKDWMLYTITFPLGIMITLGMRHIYRRVYKRTERLIWLPVSVVVTSIIFTMVWYFVDVYISHFFWQNGSLELRARLEPFYMIKYNYLFMVILMAWSGLYFGIKYALDWQAEKSKALKAQSMAHKAQMKMLRYQLNPHFLFNSLNSIQVLVDENKDHAKEMIGELSEFLRYSLLHKEATFVNLSNELEAIQHYFSIEKKRFEEKLEIDYAVDDNLRHVQVLTFLLHPLIENAVKYGMRTSPMPLKIRLSASKTGYGLLIEVCNTGKWIERKDGEEHKGTGTGLCNVRERLENAYGEDHRFEIIKHDDKTCIRIEIKEDYLNG